MSEKMREEAIGMVTKAKALDQAKRAVVWTLDPENTPTNMMELQVHQHMILGGILWALIALAEKEE